MKGSLGIAWVNGAHQLFCLRHKKHALDYASFLSKFINANNLIFRVRANSRFIFGLTSLSRQRGEAEK
jgi:hypothetical protein